MGTDMEDKTLAQLHWEQLLAENAYEQADHFFEKSRQEHQLTPEMCYVMGLWHQQRENYGKSADAFAEGLMMMPDSSELYFALANSMRSMENDAMAMKYYRHALALNPTYLDALFCMGQLQGLHDEKDKARESFCKALRLSTRVEEKIAIAVELSYIEASDEAMQVYMCATIDEPDNYFLYSNLGVELAEQEAYEDAIFCHEKALSMTEEDGDVWYNAACTYALCGETMRSLLALERSIVLDPANRDYAAEDMELENLHGQRRFWKLIGRVES